MTADLSKCEDPGLPVRDQRSQASAAERRSGLDVLADPRFDRISVGGIGLRVGLSDPSHFIRQCRRHLGMTPGAFRRQR